MNRFRHIDPPIVIQGKDGISRELFARDGEEVLVSNIGRSHGLGATRISVGEAQALVTQANIGITCGQSDALHVSLWERIGEIQP